MAVNDLIKIGLAIAEDSPINAAKMVDLIEGKVTPLAKHPDIGRAGRKRGTRELVVHESCLVINREVPAKVEILQVKLTAQQWP